MEEQNNNKDHFVMRRVCFAGLAKCIRVKSQGNNKVTYEALIMSGKRSLKTIDIGYCGDKSSSKKFFSCTALDKFNVTNVDIKNCKLQDSRCCDIDQDIFEEFWSEDSYEIFTLPVLPKRFSELF